MAGSSKASASVIAAAVVAILCALLVLFSCSLTFFGLLFLKLPVSEPALPPWAKAMELAMMAFIICLSVFGIVTGVALIYLRNWARISILIWGGVFAFFAAVGIPFAFLLPKTSPSTAPQLPESSQQLIQWILLFVYGLPLVVGIWWLMLFNRQSIKAQFTAARGSVEPAPPQKPRCPFPIAVLAWFYIGSILNVIFLPFISLRVPVFLFGVAVPLEVSLPILLLTSLGFFVAGVGVLKLKPWSYSLMMGLQMFWLASGTVSVLSPHYETALISYMKDMQAWMHFPETEFVTEYFAKYFRGTMIFALVLSGAILALLVHYRRRFLEAASAATASSIQSVTLRKF